MTVPSSWIMSTRTNSMRSFDRRSHINLTSGSPMQTGGKMGQFGPSCFFDWKVFASLRGMGFSRTTTTQDVRKPKSRSHDSNLITIHTSYDPGENSLVFVPRGIWFCAKLPRQVSLDYSHLKVEEHDHRRVLFTSTSPNDVVQYSVLV